MRISLYDYPGIQYIQIYTSTLDTPDKMCYLTSHTTQK